MLVNIEDNKFQILIASGVSIIYYNYSKNEINSMCLALILSVILRKINIDTIIKNLCNKFNN